MHTHNGTRQLTSVFLIASLAFNVVTPLSSGESLDGTYRQENPPEEEISGLASQDDAFVETLALESEEYIDHLMLGDTSFLAAKVPPTKTQVVVSRQWLFVTAYSSTPDQTDDTPFITAANTHVRDGVVAANFAYFGTKMRFPTLYGDKVFIVEDRMNSRYPYRIDIWMRTREEAKQFGVKIVPIEIITEI